MTHRARRATVLLAAAIAALTFAAQAGAKSFTLPQADVAVEVAPDGAVRVRERIQYAFSGSFSGGYREIPLRRGESIADVSVREGGALYRPGACTELGCLGAPGTFGVADLGGRTRIVWHYAAADQARTFEVRYAIRGLAVAYDDVVDVNVKVWGDEWKVGLGRFAPGAGDRPIAREASAWRWPPTGTPRRERTRTGAQGPVTRGGPWAGAWSGDPSPGLPDAMPGSGHRAPGWRRWC